VAVRIGSDFVRKPRRTLAAFGGRQRILSSSTPIQANPGGPQRTTYFATVDRKVAGSSPAPGAIVLNTNCCPGHVVLPGAPRCDGHGMVTPGHGCALAIREHLVRAVEEELNDGCPLVDDVLCGTAHGILEVPANRRVGHVAEQRE
jgi:hypothetical protein